MVKRGRVVLIGYDRNRYEEKIIFCLGRIIAYLHA
jgi:hypothetical protein